LIRTLSLRNSTLQHNTISGTGLRHFLLPVSICSNTGYIG
jgi:hypothetical protein